MSLFFIFPTRFNVFFCPIQIHGLKGCKDSGYLKYSREKLNGKFKKTRKKNALNPIQPFQENFFKRNRKALNRNHLGHSPTRSNPITSHSTAQRSTAHFSFAAPHLRPAPPLSSKTAPLQHFTLLFFRLLSLPQSQSQSQSQSKSTAITHQIILPHRARILLR